MDSTQSKIAGIERGAETQAARAPRTLAPGQVSRYFTDGFLFPLPALTPAEARSYRAQVQELEDFVAGRGQPLDVTQPQLYFHWAYELATHPKVLDFIEDIIGPNILVHSASIFFKPPRATGFISWHQDGFYWRLSEPRLVSAWIALTDSTSQNGCMRVIPATHRHQLPHTQNRSADNMLLSGLTVEAGFDPAQAVDVVLKVGELSLHHVNAVHGSNPNVSDTERYGFAVRYTVPEVRQAIPHHHVLLARGCDEHHNFELLAEPPDSDIATAYAAQSELARAIRRIRKLE